MGMPTPRESNAPRRSEHERGRTPGGTPPEAPGGEATPEEARVLASVLAAMRQVRFGYVQVILQDGKVVQIDTLERERLLPPGK